MDDRGLALFLLLNMPQVDTGIDASLPRVKPVKHKVQLWKDNQGIKMRQTQRFGKGDCRSTAQTPSIFGL